MHFATVHPLTLNSPAHVLLLDMRSSEVCNEPAELVPAEELCRFYDRAVRAIREAGTSAEHGKSMLFT